MSDRMIIDHGYYLAARTFKILIEVLGNQYDLFVEAAEMRRPFPHTFNAMGQNELETRAKLVGESIGLHPVWLMLALLAFGSLFGFTGLLIAVPISAAVGVLVRFAMRNYLASPLYLGGSERKQLAGGKTP